MTTTFAPEEVEVVLPDAPPEEPVEAPVGAGLTCASALLATSAFGWIAGSVFRGVLPRGVGLLAAGLGVGVVLLSTRVRRPSLVQYAGAGAAFVLGALLVAPFAAGGTDLPSLVVDAIRSGGLGQPPVAFDPGWRFLLVIAVALLGQTSAGLALAYGRPRVATAVVLPFVIGGSLLQPPGSELSGTLIALLLLVASMAVSYGADLAADGASSGGFELRRLARGAAALVVLGGLLGGASQIGFLFPPPSSQQVVPPMRPPTPPPAKDRVLFTVTSDRPMTWRLGTLDVYRDTAWLTPPYDVSSLVPVNGPVPRSDKDTRGPLPTQGSTTVRYTLGDYGSKALPGAADPLAVRGKGIVYDPRTQALRTLDTRLRRGTSYQVTVPPLPSGAALTNAPPPPARLASFLQAPPPPPEVTALLADAPTELFARLQFVRRAYFAKVVAAGAGNPLDVPPSRVVEMLQGKEASPYEITAGEALLARWAGVPARIGYGWYGGQPTKDARTVEIRPRNGATWLEAYFEGSGWVPIVGTPPRAKSSLRPGQRNNDPSVRPTDELALVVYAPVQQSSVRLAYVYFRYYALRALPGGLVALLLVVFYPGAVKLVRRLLRRRAARRLGPTARIAASYAELRDLATDLNVGGPALSPLELVDRVAPDAEHRELAWLVTRALWGDLGRDLQQGDVDAAEEMSRSVAKRLRQAQPAFSRLSAVASRSSLNDPWTRELPTLWRRHRRPRVVPVVAAAVVLALVVAVALSQRDTKPKPSAVRLPDRVAPAAVGDVRLVREASTEEAFRGTLATDGRVFSLRQRDVVQGSLQITALGSDTDTRSPRVRDELVAGVSGGRFRPARIGDERIYRLDLPEQKLLLSFGRDGHTFYLLVARAAYTGAEQLFAEVLAYARGEAADDAGVAVPVPDPRRGSPE
ncbi:MAG: hypothetical protein QOI82_2561 [Actinomycetota bacterium]|jgi:hypothetical protein|nr:hypothetical protein [Actinomycetota bacterium]